jgi:hypothetical protein
MSAYDDRNVAEKRLEAVDDRTVLVDYGPMHIYIQATDRGRPLIALAMEGGRRAFGVLEEIARFLPLLKRKAAQINATAALPEVVRKMIGAAQKMEAADLTPMAAVAGASSDAVADYSIAKGGTKIVVDNGGDVALRLKGDETARVGIKTEIDASRPAYLLVIRVDMGVGGVATSGLGGRSFTKGIASAVTVLAESAALADAAATVIANATYVEDPAIKRYLPETVYPDTDIAGEWVTGAVGEIGTAKIDEALMQGLAAAERLGDKGLIVGAFIAVKRKVAWTPTLNPYIKDLR